MLDTSRRDSRKESPVLVWAPGQAGDIFETMAPDFGSFFLEPGVLGRTLVLVRT